MIAPRRGELPRQPRPGDSSIAGLVGQDATKALKQAQSCVERPCSANRCRMLTCATRRARPPCMRSWQRPTAFSSWTRMRAPAPRQGARAGAERTRSRAPRIAAVVRGQRLRQRGHRHRHQAIEAARMLQPPRLAGRHLPAHEPRFARAPAGPRGSGDRHPDPGISREQRPAR